jgi:hypothetical protein
MTASRYGEFAVKSSGVSSPSCGQRQISLRCRRRNRRCGIQVANGSSFIFGMRGEGPLSFFIGDRLGS